MNKEQISHILHNLGEENKSSQRNAVSPPIYNTSTFAFDTVQDFASAIANEMEEGIYSRGANPTVRLLEQKLAALQGTASALCFSSGSAAVSAAVLSVVAAGDHILCIENAYSWTTKLCNQHLSKFGVKTTFFRHDISLVAFEALLQPNTKMVIFESPTSLFFDLQDLEAFVAVCKQKNIVTLADNSYGSPLSQYPVEIGIDLVCHSATKYIAGHSDVLAGLVCGSEERIKEIFYGPYMTLGASLAPDSAWLILRSLRTLEMRIAAASKNAIAFLDWLKRRPEIEKISWPWIDEDHKELANQQCYKPMPMFSIFLKTRDPEKIEAFCNALQVFQMAVSWGSYESLLLPGMIFNKPEIPNNMMRIYIGFENHELLVSDFEQAFDQMKD